MEKIDVFISYAHLDNEDSFGGNEGWVTDFHRRLMPLLNRHLGRRAVIYRDIRLNPMSQLWPTIQDSLSRTKLFLVVSSPRYHLSPSCLKEVNAFLGPRDLAEVEGTHLQRIVKVGMTYVERKQQIDSLQALLPSDFFERDEMTGTINYWIPEDRKYKDQINLLSQQLAQVLNMMDGDAS